MKITDKDYDFALANKIMADRLISRIDNSENREEKVKEAQNVLYDTVAQTRQRLTWPIYLIGVVFTVSNLAVLVLLGYSLSKDFDYMALSLERGKDYVRLIEPKTILALVAGVTVQSVIAFIAIVKGFYHSVTG